MRRTGWKLLPLVLLPLVLLPGSVSAQPPSSAEQFRELRQRLDLSGSLRAGYWSSSRNLDGRVSVAALALWLKAMPRLWSRTLLVLEGRVDTQSPFREDMTNGVLRQAYLEWNLGSFDCKLGKQIIAWGRTDRLNPTDNLSPKDFTLLVPEDEDQRFGTPALQVTGYVRDLSVTGVWLPDFEPHIFPIERPPPPITLREQVQGETLGQWAIKIEQTGRAVDWSLSYFDGLDLFPDLGIGRLMARGPEEAGAAEILLRHHRLRVVGADAAATMGRFSLRGEVAYTFTSDTHGHDPEVKNPFLFLVLGGDRTFLEHLNINIQYLLRVVSHFQDPEDIADPFRRALALRQAAVSNQRDRVQHGISLRVSYRWFNETLQAELAAVASSPRLDSVLRLKVVYALTDRWKGTVGADLFRGPTHTFLGRLRHNSTAYIELRYSF